MISIKKFLHGNQDEHLAAWLVLVRSVIQSIGNYAIRGDQVDYETFQKDMRMCADRVGEELSANDILVLTGAVCKSLQNYNENINRFMRMESSELHSMLALATETVISVTNASQRTVNRLRDLEKQLSKATVIEDIRLVRERLNECLEAVRAEALAQEEHGARTVESLQREVQQSGRRIRDVAMGQMIDPITGLPGPVAAQDALESGINGPSTLYVAVLALRRFKLVNARFGHVVGDQLLIALADNLAKEIFVGDRVYRWSGPSFLVLMERSHDLRQVKDEFRRITSQRLTKSIKVASRMVPILCNFAVFPISCWKSPEILLGKIHRFVTSQVDMEQSD